MNRSTGAFAGIGALTGVALATLLLLTCEVTDGAQVIDPMTRQSFTLPILVGVTALGAVGGAIVSWLRNSGDPR